MLAGRTFQNFEHAQVAIDRWLVEHNRSEQTSGGIGCITRRLTLVVSAPLDVITGGDDDHVVVSQVGAGAARDGGGSPALACVVADEVVPSSDGTTGVAGLD